MSRTGMDASTWCVRCSHFPVEAQVWVTDHDEDRELKLFVPDPDGAYRILWEGTDFGTTKPLAVPARPNSRFRYRLHACG